MDNANYLDVALRLANADLSGVDELRAALHDEPWWSERVSEPDLRALRRVPVKPAQASPAVRPGRSRRQARR